MKTNRIVWVEKALAFAFREAILFYGGRDTRRLHNPAIVFLRRLGQFRFAEADAGQVLLSGAEIYSMLKDLPCDKIARAGCPMWHARKLADAHFGLALKRLDSPPKQGMDLD
jgi:hypothetical protein